MNRCDSFPKFAFDISSENAKTIVKLHFIEVVCSTRLVLLDVVHPYLEKIFIAKANFSLYLGNVSITKIINFTVTNTPLEYMYIKIKTRIKKNKIILKVLRLSRFKGQMQPVDIYRHKL